MAQKAKIAVTGATGRQGFVVAKELLANNFDVLAIVRSPDAPQARALASLGAEIAIAEFDNGDALEAAFAAIVRSNTSFAPLNIIGHKTDQAFAANCLCAQARHSVRNGECSSRSEWLA